MEIFVWRHGSAENNSLTGRDEDRTLSPKGRDDVIRVASFIKRQDPKIEMIFSSPFLRAKETAELIQGLFGCEKGIEILPELASGTPAEKLAEALKKRAQLLNSFILVGHMPDLSGLIAYWGGKAKDGGNISLKAGGLAKLELNSFNEPDQAKIISFLTPEDVHP